MHVWQAIAEWRAVTKKMNSALQESNLKLAVAKRELALAQDCRQALLCQSIPSWILPRFNSCRSWGRHPLGALRQRRLPGA